MIKINLKTQSQSAGSFIGNFDLSLINLPLLLLAMVFTGAAPLFLDSYFVGIKADVQAQIDNLQEQKKKYDIELTSLSEIDKKIQAMEAEEKAILSRVQVIQSLLKQKANPMKIMHYISEHIPANIWITKIEIKQKVFILEGNALDYESIGKFVEALNLAIFFNKSAKLDDYRTKQSTDGATRLEGFKISANIERFE